MASPIVDLLRNRARLGDASWQPNRAVREELGLTVHQCAMAVLAANAGRQRVEIEPGGSGLRAQQPWTRHEEKPPWTRHEEPNKKQQNKKVERNGGEKQHARRRQPPPPPPPPPPPAPFPPALSTKASKRRIEPSAPPTAKHYIKYLLSLTQ